MKKILLLFVVSILTLILSGFMFIERHKKGNLFKSFLIDDVVTVDANRILNYSSNDGQFATFKNPMNVPATEWPKGTGQTINFASGIWIAGQVSDTIRTAVALFKSEFLPGKVLNWDPANPTIPGVPDDPNLDKYRFYKIRKTDLFNPSGNPDYIEWPFEDGAPVNELGKPLLLGDQTLWTIFNDFNSSPHDSLLGTQSLGIEIQNLIWAYNRSDAIGDMIFIKFLFINKSGNTMDSTYIALWSDFDIGSYIDDLAGCDTTLGLGYMWNDGPDSVYGVASPAIGFDLLQGPIVPSPGDTAIAFGRKIPNFNNLNMTAFTKNFRGDPPILNDPSSSEEAYNYMKGFDKFGQPIIDPTTRQPSPFAHPGDPETGTGWIDSVGADKRIIVVSGPLTIAPGDSQEIVAAMLIAQGSSPANSVTRLKSIDILAQGAFDNNFPFPSLVLNNNSIIFDTVFITNQIDSVVTLTNIGNGDLTIKSTNITGTNAQDFTIESGGGQATLGRFASLKITIRFSTLSEGSKSAFLVITSNAESSPDTVSLSGTGVAAKDTLFTRITTGNIVNDGASSFSSSWGDYDADGDLDLFIANTNSENNFLYRNNGDGTFTKITEGDIVNDGGSSLGSSWGDYDNDGDLDLFVVNAAGENNSLYQNNGDGTFTKITDGDIVNDGGNSQACSWGDYDNDGYLDLFVANGTLENNFLYNNDGSGTFTKITQGIIVNDGGESRGCNWADFDNDGDLDLFVANAIGENNFLYTNQGDGTFVKITAGDLVNDGGNSIGGSWGDYDNDGDLDLFATNAINVPAGFPVGNNFLYANNGDGTFTKIASGNIVLDGGDSIGSSWCDIDNDGDLDLFVANANRGGFGAPPNPAPDFLYTNNGDGTFTKIITGSVVSMTGNSIGAGFGDFDKDGDLDLFVANMMVEQNNFLYSNNGNSNNWINILCIGTTSNTSGIGAKVRVKANINGTSVWQMNEISGQTGYLSQNSLNVEFGFGNATVIDSIKIEWPSGIVRFLTNVAINQFLTVTDSVGNITVPPPRNPTPGNNADITVTPPSNFQPTINQLFYRMAGDTSYQVSTLTQAGNNLQGTIPANFVTIRGIEYYISLLEGQIQVTFPETDPVNNPAILSVQIDQLDYQLALQAETYKMIAVPLALNNTDIDSVLLDDYGEYEILPRQWRIFRWENDTYSEHLDINADFTPGTAFWLITRNGNVFDIDNSQSVISGQQYTLTLQPGWNQIGNPFAFPVDWNNITASGNAQSPVFFDGTEYQFNITLLQPWEGYFVNNLESFPVTLSVSPVEAQAAVGAFAYKMDINEENEYLIQIAGNVPGTKLKDTQNFIGLLENVTKGRDELDFLEPPPIGEYVCLSFIEGEERFAGNFKPFNGKGQEWDLEITSTLPNKQVQITLLESGQLPEDFQLYILDKDFYSLIPINNNSFTVQLDKEFPKRRLKIILGTKDYAEHNEDGIPLIPLQFSLEQNYPNPFNPETTIRYQISKRSRVILEIYNVLGQKVRTLINNEQNPSAYSVQWDGLDDAGHLVSSGVYIYHLNAGEFTASRKLALIR